RRPYYSPAIISTVDPVDRPIATDCLNEPPHSFFSVRCAASLAGVSDRAFEHRRRRLGVADVRVSVQEDQSYRPRRRRTSLLPTMILHSPPRTIGNQPRSRTSASASASRREDSRVTRGLSKGVSGSRRESCKGTGAALPSSA